MCYCLGIGRRRQYGGVDPAAEERGKRFGISAGLDEAKVAPCLHVEPSQRLDSKILGVPANSRYGDFFAFEILGPLNRWRDDNVLRHHVFGAADKHQIRRALNVSANVSHAAGQCHLGVATQKRSRDHA